MTVSTPTSLRSVATTIKNETFDRANTATRVGGLLESFIDTALLVTHAEWYGFDPAASAASNSATLQLAADAAAGGVLAVGDGTFPFNGGVVLPANTHLRMAPGTVLDFSAAGAVTALSVSGTEGATMALTSNVAKGATSFSLAALDAATLAQGDWVRVASNTVFDASNTNSEIGEIVQVKSVAGTTVNIEGAFRGGTYTTAASAVASKITFAEGVRITGGRLLGGGTVTTAGSDADCSGIKIAKGINCVVEGVRFERCDLNGVWLQDSLFCQVVRCDFADAINDAQGYGVSFDNACQDCQILDCTSSRVRHIATTTNSTATKGIARRIRYSGLKVHSTSTARGGAGGDALDTHGGCEDITIDNCTVFSSTGSGINVEGASCCIENCEIYNAAEYGIHVHNETDQEGEMSVRGCRVVKTGIEGIRVSMGFRGTVAVNRSVDISRNTVVDAVSIAFYCPAAAGAAVNRNYRIEGNSAIGCQSASGSFYLEDIQDGVFSGNVVREPTQAAAPQFRVRDCSNILVENNSVRHADTSTGIAFYINATGAGTCTKVVFQGNRAGGATPSNLRGLSVDNNATNCTVGLNDLQECTTSYSLGTGAGHILQQPPGVSGDNGNAAKTLAFTDLPTQLWNTPLTADRAVTLPGANVRARWRIVRGAGATGAFNLNVGTGPLKALGAAGTWCDVESNGTAYVLVANGAL